MIDGSVEVLLPWEMWTLRVATSDNASDDAVKAAIGLIVDDPAVMSIFVDFFYFCVEDGLLIQSVLPPECSNLSHNILPTWISRRPIDTWVDPIHQRVNLEAGRIVDF